MTDIYARITITDIETGEIIPNDRFGAKMLIDAYMIGYNWQANKFNERIDSWNNEFDSLHPDIYNNLDDPENRKIYNRFVIERWQQIIDQFNDVMSTVGNARFIIEDFSVKMLDGWGHKVQTKLTN